MNKKTIAIIILSLIIEAAIISTFAYGKYKEVTDEKIKYEEKYEETLALSSKVKIKLSEIEDSLKETEKELENAKTALVEKNKTINQVQADLISEQQKNEKLNKEITTLKK